MFPNSHWFSLPTIQPLLLLLAPKPSLPPGTRPLILCHFSLHLPKVSTVESAAEGGVTELSSLHGMERKSSAAVSFGDYFFLFFLKMSVVLLEKILLLTI